MSTNSTDVRSSSPSSCRQRYCSDGKCQRECLAAAYASWAVTLPAWSWFPAARRQKRGLVVHALEGATESRVVGRAHAVEVEVVAQREHKGGAVTARHLRHRGRYPALCRCDPRIYGQPAPVGYREEAEVGEAQLQQDHHLIHSYIARRMCMPEINFLEVE